MLRKSMVLLLILVVPACIFSQKYTNVYQKKLSDVITDLQDQYKVNIDATGIKPADYIVDGAVWKYTFDIDQTLDNILKPLNLMYLRRNNGKIQIVPYSYHQRNDSDGKRHLDSLLTLYPDSASFFARKAELKSCFLKTLGINPSVKKNSLHPIIRSKRIMDGYSVESVAFESFPGFYITGSLYRPLRSKGKLPAIICPHGHFPEFRNTESIDIQGRYRPDMQIRCAALARMGAVVFNYDMYGWGDSRLQSAKTPEDFTEHYTGFSLSMQTWNSIRVVDFLTSLSYVDKSRIGVTGASGGGTQTILLTALDDRITASAPVVMVSSSFYGGCGCESGLPIHSCGRFHTNNAEIAALAAPRPMLLVSDGTDWTWTMPGTDYPYLKKVYTLFNKEEMVSNVHLPTDKHDYGYSKRVPVYSFFAKQFNLDIHAITDRSGKIDEDFVKIEKASEQHVFQDKSQLPPGSLFGHENIVKAFEQFQGLPQP